MKLSALAAAQATVDQQATVNDALKTIGGIAHLLAHRQDIDTRDLCDRLERLIDIAAPAAPAWAMPSEPPTDPQRATLIALAKCQPMTGILEKNLHGDLPRSQWQRDVKTPLEAQYGMKNKRGVGYYLPEHVKEEVRAALNVGATKALRRRD